jgi:hypothetical protein
MNLSPDRRKELYGEYLTKANEVFERMFDEGRQDQLVTMTQREDCILEMCGELQAWLMARHLELDSLASPKASDVMKCPKCGHDGVPDGRDAKPVPRRITTRTGKQEFRRRKYRCPHCRAVFFPPRPKVAARSR